jgi:hypothetical protein
MNVFASVIHLVAAIGLVVSPRGFHAERPDPPFIGARGNTCDPVTGCPVDVYAHTSATLYRIDLGASPPVANLVGQMGAQITDITRLGDGRIFGVSFDALFQIDASTGRAQRVGSLGVDGVNGLTSTGNRLLASSTEGVFYTVDPASGRAGRIGRFGQGITSSGDMCFGPNGVLYLTAPHDPQRGTSDRLMRVDPATGNAVLLGNTGLDRMYGLTFTGSQMLGFTEAGIVARIDPSTGAATPIGTLQVPFWGSS